MVVSSRTVGTTYMHLPYSVCLVSWRQLCARLQASLLAVLHYWIRISSSEQTLLGSTGSTCPCTQEYQENIYYILLYFGEYFPIFHLNLTFTSIQVDDTPKVRCRTQICAKFIDNFTSQLAFLSVKGAIKLCPVKLHIHCQQNEFDVELYVHIYVVWPFYVVLRVTLFLIFGALIGSYFRSRDTKEKKTLIMDMSWCVAKKIWREAIFSYAVVIP